MSLKFSCDDVISQLQLHRAPLRGAIKIGTEDEGLQHRRSMWHCGVRSVRHHYHIPNPGVVVDFAEAILLHCSALNKDNLTTMYYM